MVQSLINQYDLQDSPPSVPYIALTSIKSQSRVHPLDRPLLVPVERAAHVKAMIISVKAMIISVKNCESIERDAPYPGAGSRHAPRHRFSVYGAKADSHFSNHTLFKNPATMHTKAPGARS